MKLNQIVLSLAACLAAPAFALTPTQINNDPNTVHLWIAGAGTPAYYYFYGDSLTRAVYDGLRRLCADNDANGVPDDLHVYLRNNFTSSQINDGQATPGKNYDEGVAAYACTMGPRAGSLDGVQTVVYHTFTSTYYPEFVYSPHLSQVGVVHPSVSNRAQRLKDITLGSSTCSLITPTNPSVGTIPPATPTYMDCGSITPIVAPNTSPLDTPTMPQGGFSETEYALLKLNLGIPLNLDSIGSEYTTHIAQVFGLAVSYPLYYLMQQSDIAAGKIAATCDDAPYTPAAPNLTGPCQPNTNRQKYSSLVSVGSITNKDGSLFGGAPGSVIQVHRLASYVGTQAASNVFFLNTPCATGEAGGASSPAGGAPYSKVSYNGGKVLVYTHISPNKVESGLTAATYANQLAIGVLSMANIPPPRISTPSSSSMAYRPTSPPLAREIGTNTSIRFKAIMNSGTRYMALPPIAPSPKAPISSQA